MACLLRTSVVAAGHPSSDAPRCCATFTALGCSASSSGCDAHSIAGIMSALRAKNFFISRASLLREHRTDQTSALPYDLGPASIVAPPGLTASCAPGELGPERSRTRLSTRCGQLRSAIQRNTIAYSTPLPTLWPTIGATTLCDFS